MCLKDNNKTKSLSKRVLQVVSCQLLQEIYIRKVKILSPLRSHVKSIHLPERSDKWIDLTWLRKGSKFNLHHLREISVVIKMTELTPKSGIMKRFKSMWRYKNWGNNFMRVWKPKTSKFIIKKLSAEKLNLSW